MKGSVLDRRRMLESSCAAGGLLLLKPATVFGSHANSAIEIGIVGCGNRGAWIAPLFVEHSGSHVAAVADLYPRRIEDFFRRTKLTVDPARVYKGIRSGEELIQSKLDAVVLEAAPYIFPTLANAAVKAGKHVFMAKPVAVDVPGCLEVKAAGAHARGKLNFLVDFQTRAQDAFREAMQRVRRGDIGKIILGQVSYNDTSIRPQPTEGLPPAEARMRNFYFYRALAGDLPLSRDIHVIDGANFFLGAHPEKAMGIGRSNAHSVGDCHDNYILTYWYPNDCVVAFSSTEFTTGYRDMCMRFYGTAGTLDAHYNGTVTIGGSNPWPGVQKDDTFRGGAVANIKAFIGAIRSGSVLNNVDDAVDSTLSALLGRMAADSGRVVTWEEVLRDRQRLDPRVEEGA